MRKMKKTSIPWLPELAEDFSVGYVKQYFFVSKDLSNEGEPERVLKLARAGIVEKDVTTNEGQMAASYAGYNKVQVGDLLLNPMDLYSGANCNVSELNGVISPAYSNLRAKKVGSVVPKFYDYYFKSQYWLMAMFAHGKGVSFDNRWTLNNDSLRTYEIPVALYEVQKAIVENIQSEEKKVEALIANVQAQIEKLKAYKQSLITEVVTKGLDPTVTMKDSGVEWIGEIPEHWRTAKLQYCAQIRSGITLGKKYPKGTRIIERPYLRVANVQNGGVVLDDVKMIEVSMEDDKQYRLSAGEVLMTEGGDRDKLGRGCVWEGQITPCLHQNHIFALRTNGLLKPQFLAYATASDVGRVYFDITATKTTNLASTNSSKVLAFNLPLPTIGEQQEIISYLDGKCLQIDRLIAIKQEKIRKLEQYKKSLIYEYVTGKKEVL